jgi:DNA-binding XRE family transcriptional regulator
VRKILIYYLKAQNRKRFWAFYFSAAVKEVCQMDITEARFKKRLTQWDLRIKTGISQTKISLIERGYVDPHEEEKQKIAKALGLRVDQITWPDKNGTTGGADAQAEAR